MDFNPSCQHYDVGWQYWTGGTYTDQCYKEANVTVGGDNFTLHIEGEMNNTLNLPAQGSTYLKGENVTIFGEVGDADPGCADLSQADIYLNLMAESGQTYNYFTNTGIDNDYVYTINTSTLQARWYNTTALAYLPDYYNGTEFIEQHFYVKTRPVFSGPVVLSKDGLDIGGWGENWTFRANLTDEDLANVTVTLHI